jgi:hypothetical protein
MGSATSAAQGPASSYASTLRTLKGSADAEWAVGPPRPAPWLQIGRAHTHENARALERGRPINAPTAWHCPRSGAGTGNAAQYRAIVFNFARTWESIYLNFDFDATRAGLPGSFRGVPGGTFRALKR